MHVEEVKTPEPTVDSRFEAMEARLRAPRNEFCVSRGELSKFVRQKPAQQLADELSRERGLRLRAEDRIRELETAGMFCFTGTPL